MNVSELLLMFMNREETDSKVIAKQQKKEDDEAKKREAQRKKEEKKALEEKERSDLAKISNKAADRKVTRAQIEEHEAQDQARRNAERERKKKEEEEPEIEPNYNQIHRDQRLANGENSVDARSLDDAISQLSIEEQLDKHPEKRLKAAFKAYEEENLPILKRENPGLKLSQVRELLWNQWQKSPENPLNQ